MHLPFLKEEENIICMINIIINYIIVLIIFVKLIILNIKTIQFLTNLNELKKDAYDLNKNITKKKDKEEKEFEIYV